MEEIVSKIERFVFNNLVDENHIIVDDGSLNVSMENYGNQRYTFIDDKDFGERTILEEKKIIMLNEIMEILSDLHQYIHENECQKPIYFDKKALENKIKDDYEVNTDDITNEVNTDDITTEVNTDDITDDISNMDI
tara:strand:+ start:294 stop:701 length:408 start_codon:yes stop_codon:yes gene_type:complete